MNRVVYRQLTPTTGTMVANHSIVGPRQTPSAVRWYQFYIRGPVVSIAHQGTVSPNSNSRFMGSIAIDKNQNIVLGHNLSGPNVYPSITITGRAKGDPKNTMRQEKTIQVGAGYYEIPNTNERFTWGSYSNMAVDPVDNCTFWYTNQYLKTTGFNNWSSKIVKFKFPGCTP
jgi:hypothetical protein